ncbi:MAG: 1-deoxy-D-xylulose-5-phosphate reductoisomerase [Rhizobiales bacterium 65-9]|nr:1-deoxy-D-xylulose-5-phosphate reductoisomerase [Hyphomicrobiales bacterium]OJY35372.1 MAG: 1-deoxy-D-xylulose-5-phosphate reductoisomerase [Rhizobiales bacterium 65-9]
MRSVTLLGATGSVGSSAVDILLQQKDRFSVEAVAAAGDVAALADVARRLGAKAAAIADEASLPALRDALSGSGVVALAGDAGVIEAARRPSDIVVGAIAGTAGLAPTHAALAAGRRIALANKECLVCAGAAFMRDARAVGAEIMPVDSEHNAIFQALAGAPGKEVDAIILTASGGPFRLWDKARIEAAAPKDALAHPTWSMGAKITVDSAGLMNKGLELVEAHHLFDAPIDKLKVLVHPQSAVHGLVQFRDGSLTAGMAAADMRVPIGHALNHPDRPPLATRRLDLAAMRALEFFDPDMERFPALKLVLDAIEAGGAMPTVLNAANEIAVEAFLLGRLRFGGIAALVGSTCAWGAGRNWRSPETVSEALAIDHEARSQARALLPGYVIAAT